MQYRLRNELLALGRNPDDLMFHLFLGRAANPADAQRKGAPGI
jgi:hypothetical protein